MADQKEVWDSLTARDVLGRFGRMIMLSFIIG